MKKSNGLAAFGYTGISSGELARMYSVPTRPKALLRSGLTAVFLCSSVAPAIAQDAARQKPGNSKADGKISEAIKAKAKAAQPVTAQREGYKIGPGDVIDVLVWKEPDASISGMVVRADGKVTIPFLKDITVAGYSPAEIEGKIKTDLAKFIQDPEVSVIIKQVTSEKIYVIGAVRKPGPLIMATPLNVLQAIAEAGGPTEYAKKKKMYILRGSQKIPVNYDTIIKGLSVEQNIGLLPGDTIVVP